jgi:PTH1 family peptidyl-tRNA hydrolase
MRRLFRRIRERIRSGSSEPDLDPDPKAKTEAVPECLVVGLGNPGPKYARTRHNVGFRIVEALAARHGGEWRADPSSQSMLCGVEIAGRRVALMAPQTFMNRSGESVESALERWPGIDPSRDLIVLYDDLDLPTGRIRLRPRGGAGGHNGIGDVLERLGTRSVARLRFGIGHPGSAGDVLDWVLAEFSEAEERDVLPAAIESAATAVETVIETGLTIAMGRFNAAPPTSG